MEVVIASGNAGKLREFSSLLEPLDVTVRSQGHYGIEPAPEIGVTFVENALEKARYASRLALCPAIADDSGLVVPALGGEPGIYSARYAGEHGSDADNNAKLLEACSTLSDRSAYFYCALVYLRSPEDPAPLIATAAWHGTLLESPQGDNGFGYDPLFWIEAEGATSAQLDPDVKNQLSHRGQATRALLQQLQAVL